MENIHDELILGAVKEPERKFHSVKKLRWTAVAACLALLLAVPVVAEVFGFTLSFNESGDYWDADTNAVFAPEEYSEAVRKVEGQEYFVMQNMTEAEEFIGIDLPDNAFLENAGPMLIEKEYFSDGSPKTVHCDVFVDDNNGNYFETHTNAYYRYGTNDIFVTYYTFSEYSGGFSYKYNGHGSVSEEYVTPSGRKCGIIIFEGEPGYKEVAVAEVNRVLVMVNVSGYDKEAVREAITEILDAYN